MKIKASRIGSPELAEHILTWWLYIAADENWWSLADNWRYENGPSPETPEGWTLLGFGADRVTFKGPDGFAYKVNRSLAYGHDYTDYQMRQEWDNYKKLASHWLPPNVRLPLTWSYTFDVLPLFRVNVMECFDKEPAEWNLLRVILNDLRALATYPGYEHVADLTWDSSANNVRIVDGMFVKIDMGM